MKLLPSPIVNETAKKSLSFEPIFHRLRPDGQYESSRRIGDINRNISIEYETQRCSEAIRIEKEGFNIYTFVINPKQTDADEAFHVAAMQIAVALKQQSI